MRKVNIANSTKQLFTQLLRYLTIYSIKFVTLLLSFRKNCQNSPLFSCRPSVASHLLTDLLQSFAQNLQFCGNFDGAHVHITLTCAPCVNFQTFARLSALWLCHTSPEEPLSTLRWRIIWQREVLGLKSNETAANLGVDCTTVWRTVKLFRETGDVQKFYPSIIKKITPVTEYIIVTEVHNHPGIMLHELQAELVEQTGVAVCLSTICRFLHRIGFTARKLRLLQSKEMIFFEVSLYLMFLSMNQKCWGFS